MVVALIVRELRKRKRIQYVVTDVNRSDIDHVGASCKGPTNTFKKCLCSVVLLQMQRQAS